LEDVIVHFSGRHNEPLLHSAEALYAAERGLERDDASLAERLPRLQAFARGMTWLAAHDPERLQRLRGGVRAHRARLARLGLGDHELPDAPPARAALRLAGRDALLVAIGMPVAVVGIAAWYVPYVLPRLVVRLQRPAFEAISTVKLVTALAVFPIVYAVWIVLAARAWGWVGALVVAIVLPAAGFATAQWRRHWTEFRSELGFSLRAALRPNLAAALRARRAALADEIDRIADDWEAETRARAAVARGASAR
jgi:hypothetical protein